MTTTDTTDADGITGEYDIDDTADAANDDRDDDAGQELAVPQADGTLDMFGAPAMPQRRLTEARTMLHDHVAMMRDAFILADAVCYTSAVPDRYRGKPKDGAAAVLYGAPLGMDPMTSLQKVISVHGTPSLEARSMKGLLKSKGFRFRVVERSATVFEIWAWEPGTPVTIDDDPDSPHYRKRILPDEESRWTIERARLAEFCPVPDDSTRTGYKEFNKKSGGTAVVGNMKYITQPQEMLEAKGTAEVCRAIAPDVLMGMPYTAEELETERWASGDDDRDDGAQVAEPAPARARGTAGLKERARRARKPKAEPAQQEPQDADEVPLPDEAATPAANAEPADSAPPPTVPDHQPAETSPAPPTVDATPEQADVEAAIDNGDVPVVTHETPDPEPAPAPAPADDMEMSPSVRSKGEDMLVGLLINGEVSDADRADVISEVVAKRPDATYRRIDSIAALTNTELKFLVDTLRVWKQKDELLSWCRDAGNNATLRAEGMLPE